jgi:ATP/maltotriose-dependent transcriptional regulator MalT
VHAEFVFGHVEYAVGNLDAAGDHFTRSVEGFKSGGNAWGTGQVLSAMAWVALAKGQAGEAERLLDEAVSALRRAGPWSLLLGLYIRAILSVQRGNPDEAIAVARESLTHIRNLQDKRNFLYMLVPLAAAAGLKGDDAWVARILGARDSVTETTGATVVDASAHDLQEAVELEARVHLGPERWALAYAAGR